MRYLLFAGDDYYPLGGARDLVGCYSDLQDAKGAYDGQGWAHIYDIETCEIIFKFGSSGAEYGWHSYRLKDQK